MKPVYRSFEDGLTFAGTIRFVTGSVPRCADIYFYELEENKGVTITARMGDAEHDFFTGNSKFISMMDENIMKDNTEAVALILGLQRYKEYKHATPSEPKKPSPNKNGEGWDRDRINHLLLTNDKAVGRALVHLNNRQTEDEQETNQTKHTNNRGFRHTDSKFGSSCAKFFLRNGYLTPKQLGAWRKKNKNGVCRLAAYHRQLIEEIEQKARGK